jgi:hypothetical protein
MEHVNAVNMKALLAANVDRSARLLTDEALYYKKPGKDFAAHETVKHSLYEYARGDVTVNSCESFHALLRRGLAGSFHHVSRHHLHRYVDEFTWRWNRREATDAEKSDALLGMVEGRRLTYKMAKKTPDQGK